MDLATLSFAAVVGALSSGAPRTFLGSQEHTSAAAHVHVLAEVMNYSTDGTPCSHKSR